MDELLLRNQSMEITEADHSMKLKQNILLNSLDQEVCYIMAFSITLVYLNLLK